MAETAKEKRERKAREREAAEAAKQNGDPAPAPSEAIQKLNQERALHPDRTPDAHGEQMRVSSGGAKVMVGFKVGVPFVDLQLSRLIEVDEQTQTGLRRTKIPERFGPVVRIRGTAYPRGIVPKGFPPPPEMESGAAITRNVDKDFMVEWTKLNRLNPIVQNKMIFFAENEQDFRSMARELAGLASGFEPLNPADKRDPRLPKPTNKDLTELEPAKPGV